MESFCMTGPRASAMYGTKSFFQRGGLVYIIYSANFINITVLNNTNNTVTKAK
jgi:hypothetical protein